MAIESKREGILDYILGTTLPLINGSGNYNLSPNLITRNVQSPDQFEGHQFPLIMIVDDFLTTYNAMTNCEYITGSIQGLDDGMGVGLIGVVQVSIDTGTIDTGIVSQECNKIHSDMIIAMFNDRTLGGNCETLSLKSSRNSLDWVENGGLGICFQEYRINYIFAPKPNSGTPTT